MSARLPTGMLVTALLRRVNDAGGLGMVRARGDAQAGGVLVLIEGAATGERRALERGPGADGRPVLVESRRGDGAPDTLEEYWRRRRARDPDLWVIELDVPEAERFVVETLLIG